jgi:hypothetical protein
VRRKNRDNQIRKKASMRKSWSIKERNLSKESRKRSLKNLKLRKIKNLTLMKLNYS